MNIKQYKILSAVMLWLSIAFVVIHFVWCSFYDSHALDMQSILLNVIPYGVPIFAFALARREFGNEAPRWSAADTVFGVLFIISYLAMIIHVTVAGCIYDFINVYFNVPVVYSIPIALLGIAWLIARSKPKTDASIISKVLYSLPIIVIAAMVVHCGTLCIVEWTRAAKTAGVPITSFPWWGMPLIFGTLYLIAAGMLYAVYAAYNYLQKRKKKTEKHIV